MPKEPWPPPGWKPDSYQGHTYYLIDRSGPDAPSVLLMHEFPGISKHLKKLANEVAKEFRVVVPSILGRDGHPDLVTSGVQLCIRREIHAFATGRTSPAVTWLRGLADEVVAGDADRRYGVIGMCMTGGFALAVAVDPRVPAAVVAQPAIPAASLGPIRLRHYDERAADLGLSPVDRDALQEREGLQVRALRFRDDNVCPKARLDSLKNLLAGAVEVQTLTDPDPGSHSTLTGDKRNDDAVLGVIEFLRARLTT
ncbi:MAG: dienelactone hydrolase family protein [Actinomycetota bacterium]|nr:dienelactone hydrolase family protein [Actinomycetota bacterium]